MLNDIFRYLLEDEEEADGAEGVQRTAAETGVQEQPPTATNDIPQTLTSTEDIATQEHDATVVDQALEKAIEEQPALTEEKPPGEVDGVLEPADILEAEEAPVAAVSATDATPEPVAEATEPLQEVPSLESEKPQDPEPTPVASPPKPTPAQPAAAATPAAPPKPAAPKTWASMLASNRAPVPAIPSPSPAPSPAIAPKAAPVAPNPASQAAAPTPAAVQVPPTEVPEPSDTPVSTGSEWQTAGADHGKKQNRQQQQTAQQPAENSRGYIKNVSETVDGNALRAALSKAGEVTYLDINRAKVSFHCFRIIPGPADTS